MAEPQERMADVRVSLPRSRTTLLGEAQVGAGQSVEARLSTLNTNVGRCFSEAVPSPLRWLIGHFRRRGSKQGSPSSTDR